jgi:hypothetical protein
MNCFLPLSSSIPLAFRSQGGRAGPEKTSQNGYFRVFLSPNRNPEEKEARERQIEKTNKESKKENSPYHYHHGMPEHLRFSAKLSRLWWNENFN